MAQKIMCPTCKCELDNVVSLETYNELLEEKEALEERISELENKLANLPSRILSDDEIEDIIQKGNERGLNL